MGLMTVGRSDESESRDASMAEHAETWTRDVEAARRYLAAHEAPTGGWTPEHLMHGARVPMLGEYGEGNDDREYCARLLRATRDCPRPGESRRGSGFAPKNPTREGSRTDAPPAVDIVKSDQNLLTGLSSLNRLSKRDQQRLELRLRCLSSEAKAWGAMRVAANLLRAVYQLEKT